MRSGGERIEGAAVRVGDVSTSTNAAGLATFPVVPGRYAYQISAPGYETETGKFDVPDDPVAFRLIELFASRAGLESRVTVRVKSGIDGHRIESAEVMFGDEFKLTDRDGEAPFQAVTQNTYRYYVEFDASRFEPKEGTFEVRRPKETLEFVLQPQPRSPNAETHESDGA